MTMFDAEAPTCPGCGEPAAMIVGVHAFCGNEVDCRVVMWQPGKSLEEMQANMGTIDLSGLEGLFR